MASGFPVINDGVGRAKAAGHAAQKSVYIMLSMSGSKIEKMIRYFTNDEYNHVSLCIDERMGVFYTFGRKFIRFPLIGGFKTERLNSGIYSFFKHTYCKILRLKVEQVHYDLLTQELDRFIRGANWYFYNILALPCALMKLPMEIPHLYTCSQFVASVLTKSRVCSFDKYTSLIKPVELCEIPGIEIIYEGLMDELAIIPPGDGIGGCDERPRPENFAAGHDRH